MTELAESERTTPHIPVQISNIAKKSEASDQVYYSEIRTTKEKNS